MYLFFLQDLLGIVLRGRQPVQEAADLHRENHGALQGHQTARGSAARLRHNRYGIPIDVAR